MIGGQSGRPCRTPQLPSLTPNTTARLLGMRCLFVVSTSHPSPKLPARFATPQKSGEVGGSRGRTRGHERPHGLMGLLCAARMTRRPREARATAGHHDSREKTSRFGLCSGESLRRIRSIVNFPAGANWRCHEIVSMSVRMSWRAHFRSTRIVSNDTVIPLHGESEFL